ncbi:hypothetical protein GALMADRAFT_142627 [Galerina marginata CBS 339.88]|uniref:DUF7770 domain-containing protein n=1 Tax=Galerina marginata (strain CBS 339.88) TaxID=685588 RepID=A0A067SS98_GALM3|nr:hypothetical protein GALMADRAFT_142627 [Galerina marginata CBS 339.88]
MQNSQQRSLDSSKLFPSHMDLPITDINLVVYMEHQGYCDERKDLCEPRPFRKRFVRDPPPANHYALWFGFGGEFGVSIDVIQRGFDSLPNPYLNEEPLNVACLATVRVASKFFPAPDNIGCVMREFNVKPEITIRNVLEVIRKKELYMYQFKATFKQHSGCRFWIWAFSLALETEGFAGKGFADDVKYFLNIHYRRSAKMVAGKYTQGESWGAQLQVTCAPIIPGTFLKPTPETILKPRRYSLLGPQTDRQ